MRSVAPLACLAAFLAASGCAHSYYYLPEIQGDAARHGRKGGIVYAIPPEGPAQLTLRVRALGIHKVKDTQFLGMRLSFARAGEASQGREFLRPAEQILRIGDGKPISPAFVHTKAKSQDLIELTGRASEVVELLYPLEKNVSGAPEVERYSFRWTVHFGQGSTESQAAQFDRYDAAPQQAGTLFPEDPNYPYDISPIDLPGWTVIRDPFFWWPQEPWRPWW